jgi:hypothetical protein
MGYLEIHRQVHGDFEGECPLPLAARALHAHLAISTSEATSLRSLLTNKKRTSVALRVLCASVVKVTLSD